MATPTLSIMATPTLGTTQQAPLPNVALVNRTDLIQESQKAHTVIPGLDNVYDALTS